MRKVASNADKPLHLITNISYLVVKESLTDKYTLNFTMSYLQICNSNTKFSQSLVHNNLAKYTENRDKAKSIINWDIYW